MERLLVTGGCGFIGSHLVAAATGYECVVVDDMSNSLPGVARPLAELIGREPEIHRFDLRDTDRLHKLIMEVEPEAVIHFAGMKHVGESTQIPRQYYDCNVGGLLSLLAAAADTPLRRIVFSSSGSVYGETDKLPIDEAHPHNPTNPYSATKSTCERILADLCVAEPAWSAVALRYFNPAGAHPSGRLGEWCLGPPSNLLPRLIEAAAAEDEADRTIQIHGDDFNTPDGTGVRDYVHVVDVAEAHLQALDLMNDSHGFEALNIGRGEGVSVLQLVAAVEAASGKNLKVEIGPRRPGDVSALYGDTSLAAKRLGPRKYRDLDEICADAWRFKEMNPNGY